MNDDVEHHREYLRQALLTCGIPVVALAESIRPVPGRLAGLECYNDIVTNVDVVHGDMRSEAAWVGVSTSRWSGTSVSAGPLRWLVEHYLRLTGQRFSSVDWAEEETAMVVDDEYVTAHRVRAGTHWWAARCERRGVEISVVARDWRPDTVALTTVADLETLVQWDALEMGMHPGTSATAPEVQSPDPQNERDPLRALVDVHVRVSQQQIAWWADGGPLPVFPPQMPALWRAAVDRYVTLTDHSRPQAGEAVRSIVDHMGNLCHNAAWFRENPHLRERAIAETLLFSTGLTDRVSSRHAQLAWLAKKGRSFPMSSVEVNSLVDVSKTWLDAWIEWADRYA